MITKNITPLAWSVSEFCQRIGGGLGRTTVYNAIKTGELGVAKVGDRTLIEDEEGQRWLRSKRRRAGQPSQGDPGDGGQP